MDAVSQEKTVEEVSVDDSSTVQKTEENGNAEESRNDASSVPSTLSKRQQKRLAAYTQRKEVRREVRKAYKMRRKLRRRLTEEAVDPESSGNSSPAPAPLSRKALTHAPSMQASPCSTKVVIDCAYDHLMSFKDLCKLANQVCNCYAVNRRFPSPVQLYVTGLGPRNDVSASSHDVDESTSPANVPPSTRLIDRLRIAGCDKWDIFLCNEDYPTLFDASSIVYLCAESPNRLPDAFTDEPSSDNDQSAFSTHDVYVIGGLVDHNHHIGYCYRQAQSRGHRTARLPITESGMKLSGRHVLSTVQVFQALAAVVSGHMTWAESLNAAVPPRKTIQTAVPVSDS